MVTMPFQLWLKQMVAQTPKPPKSNQRMMNVVLIPKSVLLLLMLVDPSLLPDKMIQKNTSHTSYGVQLSEQSCFAKIEKNMKRNKTDIYVKYFTIQTRMHVLYTLQKFSVNG